MNPWLILIGLLMALGCVWFALMLWAFWGLRRVARPR